TGEVVETLRHPGYVTKMALSPDAASLLTICERTDRETGKSQTTLMQWDLNTLTSQTIVRSEEDGENLLCRSVRYSPDGSRIVTIHGGYETSQCLMRIWRAAGSQVPQLHRTFRMPS